MSVVVLSYDRPYLLGPALTAVAAQQPPPREIIVVDNPSPRSREVDTAIARAKGVRLIRPATNLGFAGGMNAGIAAAAGEHVFLTEDDILLEPGAIATLSEHLVREPGCGLCTGLMLNHGAGTVRAAGMSISLDGVFRQTILRSGAPDPGPGGAAQQVDALPGSGVMGRTAQLKDLGGFRAEYFMYYEDVELCLRMRERGWTVDVVPAARIRHFDPPPAVAPPALEYHKMKNLVATYLLHARLRVLPEFLVRYGLLVPLRTAWSDRPRAAALVRGFLASLTRAPRLLYSRT